MHVAHTRIPADVVGCTGMWGEVRTTSNLALAVARQLVDPALTTAEQSPLLRHALEDARALLAKAGFHLLKMAVLRPASVLAAFRHTNPSVGPKADCEVPGFSHGKPGFSHGKHHMHRAVPRNVVVRAAIDSAGVATNFSSGRARTAALHRTAASSGRRTPASGLSQRRGHTPHTPSSAAHDSKSVGHGHAHHRAHADWVHIDSDAEDPSLG